MIWIDIRQTDKKKRLVNNVTGALYIYIYIYIYMYIEMNRSTNELECATLGFYFIGILYTCFGLRDPLQKTNNVCFDWGVILINSIIYLFIKVFPCMYFECLCVYTFAYVHVHPIIVCAR